MTPAKRTRRRKKTSFGMEPIGHVTFEARPEPVTLKEPIDTWYRQARVEFALAHALVPYDNASDRDIEAMILNHENPTQEWERLLSLVEIARGVIDRYKAGINVLEIASAKLLVVVERLYERGDIEEPGANC